MVFLLLSAVYRRAPIAFLRAESGLYLWLAQSSELAQHRFQREFVTWSYRGHWTPLAFLTEFWTTKLIGARGSVWHYRQLLLLTAVGVASLALVANLARSLGMRPKQQQSAAVAVCTMLLFQPLMFEFVVWPFMGLQLMWMTFALVACLSCVQLTNDATRIRWIWVGAGAAYASLHMLGLGIAVTLSTAGVFAFLIALSYQRDGMFKSVRRHLFLAATLLLLLTCMHCLAMVLLLQQRNTAHDPSLAPVGAVKLGLELTFRFVSAGLRSFTLAMHPVPNSYPVARYDDWMHSPNHWSFGLLGCLGSVCLFYHLCRRAFLRPVAIRVLRASVVLFCAIGVVVLVLLMICRQIISEAEPYGMLPYYTALPRYIIPLQVFLVGPLILLAVFFARRASTIFTYGCIAYALGALVIQAQYQRSPAALLTPQSRVSHRTAWRQLVEAARECRAARLPLPNFPLTALTEEWPGSEVKMFVPLLQRELGVGPSEELDLISVADYRSDDRQTWKAAPAVANFERLLEQAETGK
jgi:hypothetical protein